MLMKYLDKLKKYVDILGKYLLTISKTVKAYLTPQNIRDKFILLREKLGSIDFKKILSNRKLYLYSLVVLIPLVALLIYFGISNSSVTAFEVTVNGESAGTYILDDELLSKYSNMNNVKIERKSVSRSTASSADRLEEVISKQGSMTPKGYELKVTGYSGKRLVFSTKADVESAIKKFKEKYTGKKTYENEQVNEVKLIENYSIEPVYDDSLQAISVDEALSIIQVGTDEKKSYKLQSGDNVSFIAKKFNLTVDNVLKANPQIVGRENKLQIGEEISLIVPKPLLTVEVYKTAEYDEKIPYETKIIPTNEEYKTYSKVTVKGEEGIARIKANIIEENGVVNTSRTVVLGRNVVKEPKTQEVLKGTLQVPPKKATGVFKSPVAWLSVSSGFGPRYGGYHYGIDIPKPLGTPVYASDGGVVAEICNSRYAATGLMVRINHENGYVSTYMHLNGINVKSGERVYQGQQIGSVGSTGNSTGPHLHFEIAKGGVCVNPLPLIRY